MLTLAIYFRRYEASSLTPAEPGAKGAVNFSSALQMY